MLRTILPRYITEAPVKKQKRGDDISNLRCETKSNFMGWKGKSEEERFVVFVTGMKKSVYTNQSSLARQEPCHSINAM